jgi:prolyl-tRNA synthetase
MLQSKIFTKTLRDNLKDEKSTNAQLLTRAGFVDKLSTGLYTLLPLGYLAFKKIEKIIREEMQNAGANEILMPALHPKEPWEKTGRWQKFSGKEMFRLKSQRGKDYGLGWTHEEIVTPLVKKFVQSYKDLPLYVYQIQDKFRDELRAKSGILRNIEFVMKDLYSFHNTPDDLDGYYEKIKKIYFKIFERCGLKNKTYLTLASGGAFSKYSHEFQTTTSAGEDIIFICKKCKTAINKEIKKEVPVCPECKSKEFKEEKSIEVGNIFKLGSNYSKAFDLKVRNESGKENFVEMGCYGIGLGRLMGTIVEVSHDENGIIWPENVSPFKYHLISILSGQKSKDEKIKKAAKDLYTKIGQEAENDILWDDREEISTGVKLADSDLIGIPKRIIISERTLVKNSFELKRRKEKNGKLLKINNIKSLL